MSLTPSEIDAIVQIGELLASKGIDAYAHMREVAKQNGITEEDLAAADARFEKRYADPLAAPAPAPDPYAVKYPTALEAIGAGKPGDKVYDSHDGHFRLVYGGAGFPIDPSWTLLTTVLGG